MDVGVELAYATAIGRDALDSRLGPTTDVVTPSHEVLQAALEECKDLGRSAARDTLPGDDYKNFNFSASASLKGYVAHTIPTYSLPFRYRNEDYRRSFFAMEDHVGAAFGRIPNVSDSIYGEVDRKTRPLGITMITILALSIIASLVLGFLAGTVPKLICYIVVCSLFGIALFGTIAYIVCRHLYGRSIIKANLAEKLQTIDKVMVAYGVTPLSSEEKDALLGRTKK